jgi:hypothetical protein
LRGAGVVSGAWWARWFAGVCGRKGASYSWEVFGSVIKREDNASDWSVRDVLACGGGDGSLAVVAV